MKNRTKKPKCDCHLYKNQVCDICQGVTGKEKDKLKHIHGPNIYDPNCEACRVNGMPRSKTKNRHLLSEDDPAYLPEGKNPRSQKRLNPKYGYHSVKIKKGTLGEISKIQEELDELRDAEKQGVKIMIMCELADLFGAIRAYALKYDLKMADLHDMAKLTRKAFEQGYRR